MLRPGDAAAAADRDRRAAEPGTTQFRLLHQTPGHRHDPRCSRFVEHGGFLCDRDCRGDALPFWLGQYGPPPSRHAIPVRDRQPLRSEQRLRPAGDVATDLKDCFDLRYEKPAEISKVMTISLRDRVIDQPAKAVGLIRSLEHARRRINHMIEGATVAPAAAYLHCLKSGSNSAVNFFPSAEFGSIWSRPPMTLS